MSDYDLAQIQLGIYGDLPQAPDWSYLDADGSHSGGVVWGAIPAETPGGQVTVLCLRGSITAGDWIRDFEAWPEKILDPRLGWVHAGFFAGMEQAWATMKATTKPPYIVIGHSLGAARAAILTGLMKCEGIAPTLRVVWGEPLSGFKQLATIIGDVPARSYRNGHPTGMDHDLVTDVPFTLPPAIVWVRGSAVTDVFAPPTGDLFSEFGPWAWHHMPLYAQTMKARDSFVRRALRALVVHDPIGTYRAEK